MLTDKPNIVIARPPRPIRHKPKAAAVPARIVVGAKTETIPAGERQLV